MCKAADVSEDPQLATARAFRFALPLQVAAICYRRNGQSVEFLLVNTNGGGKWTFPKGGPAPAMSHSQAAERALQLVEWQAGIDERPEHHVAGNPGEAIEVQQAHSRLIPLRSRYRP